MTLCECGCGEEVKSGNRFINGHSQRGVDHSGSKNAMFGKHHTDEAKEKIAAARRGIPLSDDIKLAMSKARKGKPKSPEHRAAISKALTGRTLSDDHVAAILRSWREHPEAWDESSEKMRGGNDIINHHFVYDHDNPDQHIVEITRSQHSAHHAWMIRSGLEVPHFNVTEENKDIFKCKAEIILVKAEDIAEKGYFK